MADAQKRNRTHRPVHVLVMHYHHKNLEAGRNSQTGPMVNSDSEGGSFVSRMLRLGPNARDSVPVEELKRGQAGLHVQTNELKQFVTSVPINSTFGEVRGQLDAVVEHVEGIVKEHVPPREEGGEWRQRPRYQMQNFELYGEVPELDSSIPLDNVPSIQVLDGFVIEDKPFALHLTVYCAMYHVHDIFPQNIRAGVVNDGTAEFITLVNPSVPTPQIGDRVAVQRFQQAQQAQAPPMFRYEQM